MPTGRLEESRADLLESSTLVPDEAVEVGVRLTVACAGMEHMLGRHRGPRPHRGRPGALPDPAAPEAVALMIVLAFDGLFRADFESMRELRPRGRSRRRAAR